MKRTNRQTYSLLDWIGDIGGLHDGLNALGALISAPMAAFALKTRLAVFLTRFPAANSKKPENEPKSVSLVDRIMMDLAKTEVLKPKTFYEHCL